MKKVIFISKIDRIADFLTYPIRKNKKKLKDLGYEINIKYSLEDAKSSSDILCINSKLYKKKWDSPEKVFAELSEFKKYTNKLIWFDDSDGTGITHFELLPYVDLYLKKQLFRDMSLHCNKQFYGDRIFSDFYHREFGVIDNSDPYHSKLLDENNIDKVSLSWNIGMGDMYRDIYPDKIRKVIRYLPPAYRSEMTSAQKSSIRPYDFMFRGTRKYSRPTISFHRERMGEILDNLDFKKITSGRVSLKQYRQDIIDSKMVVSPFGWGEIGVRDYECWLYGSCLLKPDMSHMKTWPNVFIENETYHPLKWDFSNIESSVQELLEDVGRREELAEAGQQAYKKSISKEGMDQFCDWFIQQVEL